MKIDGIKPNGWNPEENFILPKSYAFAGEFAPPSEHTGPRNLKRGNPGTEEEIKVIRTNCFECHSKCGVLAYVKDGKLIKIEGNNLFFQKVFEDIIKNYE